MFENLITIVVIVTIFWMGAYVFYFYLSRQQENIAENIDQLKQRLGPEADGE